MDWYQWMALAALGFCLVLCLYHFFRLIRLGKPVDYSSPAGNIAQGVKYAFTGAMDPRWKESARLHLPTYTAGLFYHTGTFLSILLFFPVVFGYMPQGWLASIISAFLFISAFSGTAILIKRMIRKELRSLSNPDDFISNLLVTLFQFLTLLVILLPLLHSYSPTVLPSYYLIFTLLMLYLPLGKLRHVVYFFAARYHLGNFYGRRGVWPPQRINAED
ncbi:MAG: hypothetical protein K0B08_02035 [Bacteroidales bacterium]|nr:hypothetical protein [Bacteroidales bacterium]